ncbi:polyketide synthase dehydratase domain-containing protein [Streptomyces sp. MNU103]|uniref:polyketide synthase dehydratase domain-containing protein n=1 Tax=Streptomyces sp. MNU103 TaxID=2560024 RepID=UPI00307BAB30
MYVCDTEGVWARHAAPPSPPPPTGTNPPDSTTGPPPTVPGRSTRSGLYERLAAAGLSYGPVFRGLGTVWSRGDGSTPRSPCPTGHVRPPTVRPAPGTAGRRPARLAGPRGRPHLVELPFLWTGVSLYATGASRLRGLRLTPVTGGGMSVLLADEAGRPVASAETW